MSRSGYNEGCSSEWELICWRGAVTKAIKGKRGQAFLKEMLTCLDAMSDKKLIKEELITPDGEVCAIGSVMKARGIDVTHVDVENAEHIAHLTGIAPALVREIEFINDEQWPHNVSDELRFERIYDWVVSQIKKEANV